MILRLLQSMTMKIVMRLLQSMTMKIVVHLLQSMTMKIVMRLLQSMKAQENKMDKVREYTEAGNLEFSNSNISLNSGQLAVSTYEQQRSQRPYDYIGQRNSASISYTVN